MSARDKFNKLVRARYDRRVRRARKNKENLTALDLAKQHRAAEHEVLDTDEGRELWKLAEKEQRESQEAKEQSRQWDNMERVERFALARSKILDPD